MVVTSSATAPRWAAAFTAAAAVGVLGGTVATVVPPEVVHLVRATATGLCALGALGVIWLGIAGRLAEVSLMGTTLLIASALSFVAAVTSPGAVLAAADVSTVAGAFAFAIAGLSGLPLLMSESALRLLLARHWHVWIAGWLVLALMPFAVLLLTGVRPPVPGRVVTTLGALLGATVFASVGERHLQLFQVGRRRQSLVLGVAFLAMAATSLLSLVPDIPRPLTFIVVTTDVVLSLAAISGAALIGWRMQDVPVVMAPVTNRDPLVALQLGMDPVAAEYIRLVALKDPSTREHVVRVGELAMRVAVRQGIRGRQLRELGIGALLHDVGKLEVPDEVLRKPGALTPEEYELVKRHPDAGARLLESSSVLAGAAKFVRWHHERPDGSGYPDGLTASEIPREVAIVSVCDAYDAMTHDRHYRRAMSSERALQILESHSGTQFDATAVHLLRQELTRNAAQTGVFASVGRTVGPTVGRDVAPRLGSACTHALPAGYLSGRST